MIRMLVTILLAGLPVEGNETDSPAPFPQIPSQAGRTIAELKGIVLKRFLFNDVNESDAAHERFQKLLRNLAREIPRDVIRKVESWKGHDIDKSLILIGRDRADHPQRYRELVKTYGKSRSNFLRAPIPPELKTEHLKPQYRPAWESLLLAPQNLRTGTVDYSLRRRSIEALGAIRNNDSLPVLEQAWAATTQKNVQQGPSVVHFQFDILKVLNKYPNEAGLRTILKCLSFSDRRSSGTAEERVLFGRLRLTLRGWAARILSYPDTDASGKKWLDVLRKFPKDKLSKKDKQFVEEALAKLEKNIKAKRKP
jgi:hypothetical protein